MKGEPRHVSIIFQAKFVDGANAAGAKWLPPIVDAVRKEVRRIEERRVTKNWEEPMIRSSALFIVQDRHFTPGRIRRAVAEILPALLREEPAPSDKAIRDELLESVRHPTDRMKKAFRKLPADHQSLLVAMVQAGNFVLRSNLAIHYANLITSTANSFETVLDDLMGTFLKVSSSHVTWIHPSYRDLVIDELMTRADLRHAFVSVASVEGIGLALSESGGASGERRFPLLRDQKSMMLFAKRCELLAENASDHDVLSILRALSEAIAGKEAPATVAEQLPTIARDRPRKQLSRNWTSMRCLHQRR